MILGVELQATKLSAAPINAALGSHRKALADATDEAAEATVDYSASLHAQAAAEAKVEAHEQMRLTNSLAIAQEQRTQAKLSRALADAVDAEASSIANAGSAKSQAAADAQKLAAANLKVVESYQKAAKGSLQMVRGLVLLSGGEEDSIGATLKHVFVIQGLLDVTDGAVKLTKALAAAHKAEAAAAIASNAATGRLAAGMAAFNAIVAANPLGAFVLAVYGAYQALEYLFGGTDDASARTEAYIKVVERAAAGHAFYASQIALANAAELERIGHLDTAAEKEEALRKIADVRGAKATARGALAVSRQGLFEPEVLAEMLGEAANEAEHQLAIQEAILDAEKEQADAAKAKIDDQIQLVELRERELTQARESLRVEEDKQKALRASVGLLDAGDKGKLQRALVAAEGGTATTEQLKTIQSLGGEAGQRIVREIAAPMGKAIADEVERIANKITGKDPLADARRADEEALRRRNEATGGKSADDAIRDLEAAKQSIVDTYEEQARELKAAMRVMVDELIALRQEINRQRNAAGSR